MMESNPSQNHRQQKAILMRAKVITLSMLFAATATDAKVTLPNYLTSGMVMQQNSQLTVKGKAKGGGKVRVAPSWAGAQSVRADKHGNFTVVIATPKAGGPHSIVFDDGDITRLDNILSGEVWLCSGQSNMEFPVNGWTHVMDVDHVISTAQHPDIRLLQVKKRTSFTPLEDIETNMGGWVECNSQTVADFSAVAYFYALQLRNELGVPVGVIDATWGGTPVEAWTGADAISAAKEFGQEVKALRNNSVQNTYEEDLAAWQARFSQAGKDINVAKIHDDWGMLTVPGYWEKTVLPNFDGVVYCQRTFDLADTSGDLDLQFGMIDDEDEVWINGKRVGQGSGFNTPRSYRVPASLLKAKDNVVTVKVSDFEGEGGIAGYARIGTTDLAGEWRYKAVASMKDFPARPSNPHSSSYPTVLYNAMLSPLKHLPIKGWLWYQGCANVGRAEQYARLFPKLIQDWRGLWGKELPFYFVQLAGWLTPKVVQPESEWAALRDAQAQALELPNTAMVTAIDLGNPADIHPHNKQEVARRLAITALTRDYGKDYVYTAPQCVGTKTEGNKVVLTFDSNVKPTSSAVLGFIITDNAGQWAQANAIQRDPKTIVLSSPDIKAPKAARYDWADYPNGNLYGETGLPVTPFRTDK